MTTFKNPLERSNSKPSVSRPWALMGHLHRSMESIREIRLMVRKTPSQSVRSLIKQAKAEFNAGRSEAGALLLDGAALNALKAKHPISRTYLLLDVYRAQMEASRPTFAATMLLLAEGQAKQIENVREQAVALLTIQQKYSKHPLSPMPIID